jgi:membrane protease YdiL (CAAX protease family)
LYHAGAGSALPPTIAVGILFAGIATMLAAGVLGASVGAPILATLVAGEVVLAALPLFAIKRFDLRRSAIGLVGAPGALYAAAVLIGVSIWYLNVRLVALLPFDETRLRSLSGVVEQPPLVIALLAIAVVPAIAEEILFRGAVQRSFATRLFPPAAIVLTSLLFAGYHMSLLQLVPTFTLAIVLGALAHRGQSVLPAMLAHLLNNTMAILVSRKQPAALAGWFDAHPSAALAACLLATLAGIAIIARTPA